MIKSNIEVETPAFTVGYTGDTFIPYYIKPNTPTVFKCFLNGNTPEDIIRNLHDGTAGEGMFVDIGKTTVSVNCSGWTTFPKADVVKAFEELNAKVAKAKLAKLPPGSYYSSYAGVGGKVYTQSSFEAECTHVNSVWTYDPITNNTKDYWIRRAGAGWVYLEPSYIVPTDCKYNTASLFLVIPDPKEN